MSELPRPDSHQSNLRLLLFLLMTAGLLVPYLLIYPVRPARDRIARLYYNGCVRLAGLTVRVEGEPARGRHLLYVANHVSYLDIPVLGARLECVFVAKQEVASWPLFGFLAKLCRTVFINRATMQAARQRNAMSRRLAHENLMMFPEGTSSDGSAVLPFKSTLFSVARHGPVPGDVTVQPVSVAYTRYADGRPLAGPLAPLYAWFGDMVMLPHLRQVFGLQGAEVVVTYHEPVKAVAFETRKHLAQHCQRQVALGVERAHRRAAAAYAADAARTIDPGAVIAPA